MLTHACKAWLGAKDGVTEGLKRRNGPESYGDSGPETMFLPPEEAGSSPLKKNVCSGTLNVLPLKAEYVHRSLSQYSFHQYPEQK